MQYFLVLNAGQFERELHPPLSACWLLKSLHPCKELCRQLLPEANRYLDRYHLAQPSFLSQVAVGLPFDRHSWRYLVGEVLLFSALEIPEIQVAADTWCRLLAPDLYGQNQAGVDPTDTTAYLGIREHFRPIQQALWGSNDLIFGSAIYRPDHAGINTLKDVFRLQHELGRINPSHWTANDLAGLRGVEPGDLAEELADAQEWFPDLCALFQRAALAGNVIVHEQIF